MAAAAVIDAIGIVSGGLGIISFFQSNMANPPPQGAVVRVKGGNPGDDDPGLVSNNQQDFSLILGRY